MLSKLIAIRGNNFVIMGNEISNHCIVPIIHENPIYALNSFKSIIAVYADAMIRQQFLSYLNETLVILTKDKNEPLHLDEVRKITFQTVEAFARREKPMPVWLAGFDTEEDRPALFAFDGQGNHYSIRYVCYGKGAYLVKDETDNFWHPKLTVQEALELIKKVAQRASSVGYLHTFACTLVDKNEVHHFKNIYPYEKC